MEELSSPLQVQTLAMSPQTIQFRLLPVMLLVMLTASCKQQALLKSHAELLLESTRQVARKKLWLYSSKLLRRPFVIQLQTVNTLGQIVYLMSQPLMSHSMKLLIHGSLRLLAQVLQVIQVLLSSTSQTGNRQPSLYRLLRRFSLS